METAVKSETHQDTAGLEVTPVGELNWTASGYSADVEKVLNQLSGAAGDASKDRPQGTSAALRRRSFLARLARPFQVAYDVIAGPPMTERDRNLRALNQAYGQHSASLIWSQRITW